MFFFVNKKYLVLLCFSYDHIINRHGIAGAVQQKTVVVHCDFKSKSRFSQAISLKCRHALSGYS